VWLALALGVGALPIVAGCGAKTGLDPMTLDAGPAPDADPDVAPDADPDVAPDADPDVAPDADDADDADEDDGCVPLDDLCGDREVCGDGDDDDCDGEVDEGCFCEPGEVQACFAGPPGKRGVGSCVDGAQTCELSGAWGPCTGGIWPREDVCNGLDNLCDGCSQHEDCEISCPGPDDPRVPDGAPLVEYPLRGRAFYAGRVNAWYWSVDGGPCDTIAARFQSFDLLDAGRETARFFPRLSGDYRVSLVLFTEAGTRLSCEWIVHVAGPGLRVEMCYPESEYEDLDLFVKEPGAETDWYYDPDNVWRPSIDQCGWHNCEASIRGQDGLGNPLQRADWGYEPSDLAECVSGPQGDQWQVLGFCANPRLDVDNNMSEGTGLPENINVDRPREGETFRIMIENFTGGLAQPLVNVYCGGDRVATYGAPPDVVPDFTGVSGGTDRVGAMWRVADVTTSIDVDGTTACEVELLHAPGDPAGYYVTYDDVRY
jgi:hypothetical protein